MARILVIDDEPMILTTVVQILEREGHEVRVAENGEAALKLVADGLLDLIISDMYMPDMDGIELLTRLEEEHPGMPLLAMSGGGFMAKEELLRDARMLGAVALLKKPFTTEELLDGVSHAIEEGVADETD